MICDCRAWAIIADTTPDISKHEQPSICIRVVTRTGQCSEHLLFCKRASGTTSLEIYNCIAAALTNKGISFEKLVAQTYDGASNMSGCYNGLQAIIKEKVGDHVVYVHCYAHRLNLVLSDSAGASIQVIKLFDNLEKLYNLFRKSQKIHDLFESIQKEKKLNVLSLKRINTVRWSSREFSLKAFLQRYESIMHVLETVSTDTSFDGNQRSTSAGLLECFQTKQFIATAYLFREIFAITGPLSRYLQSIDIDFGKAISMIDSAIVQLSKLREEPDTFIKSVEQEFDPSEVSWKSTRRRNQRMMDGEQAIDEPAIAPADHWKRDTFYVAMDKVSNGIRERFKNSQTLLEAFSLFTPSRFPYLLKQYKASRDLQKALEGFCDTYKVDSYRCADELFSFFKSFQKFSLDFQDENDTDSVSSDDDDAVGDASAHADYFIDEDHADVRAVRVGDADTEMTGTLVAKKVNANERRTRPPSFIDELAILCHPDYKLVDAYPTLCQVYSIAVAVPVSSTTAERSFSALKRVKTRIRSSMIQERLES